MTPPVERPSLARAMGRAVLRRCPRCGEGGIFRRWVLMAPSCRRCGLDYERAEGYWIGAVALNLVVTEVVSIGSLVVVAVATWPDVPWTLLLIGLVAATIAVPIVFYPLSRTLWLAGERHFHRWQEPETPPPRRR